MNCSAKDHQSSFNFALHRYPAKEGEVLAAHVTFNSAQKFCFVPTSFDHMKLYAKEENQNMLHIINSSNEW